jgi:glucose-6-phosphate 1-dehydrogenase
VRLKQVPGSVRLAPPRVPGLRRRRLPHRADAAWTIALFAKTPGEGGDARGHARRLVHRGARQAPGPYERCSRRAARRHVALPALDVIEETWRIVQPLLDDPPPVDKYAPGTWGPKRVANLARRHGGWREPQ